MSVHIFPKVLHDTESRVVGSHFKLYTEIWVVVQPKLSFLLLSTVKPDIAVGTDFASVGKS